MVTSPEAQGLARAPGPPLHLPRELPELHLPPRGHQRPAAHPLPACSVPQPGGR